MPATGWLSISSCAGLSRALHRIALQWFNRLPHKTPPTLSLIGAIGAALILGLRGGGVLVSLLVLPLTVPVLIFGSGAVEATVSGLGGQGHLLMLSAMLVFALVFAPLATAFALRVSNE